MSSFRQFGWNLLALPLDGAIVFWFDASFRMLVEGRIGNRAGIRQV